METDGPVERVLLLEPFGVASHRAWAEGYAAASAFDVRSVVLSGERWRWRMRVGAVDAARRLAEACHDGWRPDVLLVSSMIDVAALLGLARRLLDGAAVVLYFHESQFSFPDPDVRGAMRSAGAEFAATHVTSMAAADRVVFNSAHHLREVAVGLDDLFAHAPDEVPVDLSEATVVPVGVDVAPLRSPPEAGVADDDAAPLILWNHRWDHDKDPQAFFRALHRVEDLDWRLAVVGVNTRQDPQEFDTARERFADRVIEWGFVDRPRYLELLRAADVVCSTAVHEYFGVAMVEAMVAGAVPLLPNRLAYPEVVPPEWHAAVLYEEGTLAHRLRIVLGDVESARSRIAGLAGELGRRFDWAVVAEELDAIVSAAAVDRVRQ